jgi:hypothetical protein
VKALATEEKIDTDHSKNDIINENIYSIAEMIESDTTDG